MSEYHDPVMLSQCVDGLKIKPGGTYVDATFGGGGHSKAIFEQLENGHLVAFDQDEDAEQNAQKLEQDSGKRSFTFIDTNFRFLEKYLRFHQVDKVDGILADLGVSSHQLDEPERGFSIRANGPLDMRMDQKTGKSAYNVINQYDEDDLIHILSAYGEIRNARTLAGAILSARTQKPIDSVDELKHVAMICAPKGKQNKYLAQVFQAVRIEVNAEIQALKEFLEQAGKVLRQDGRLVIISYHSLEDRPVKNYINKGNFKGQDEKDFYGNPIRVFDAVNRKPIIPTLEEIEKNSRARSAKLRIGRKR
ncbi:MAG: 16S rRNA (cytosine(1402)-N(4))-methyltransferase RsmH [Bacteroidota bacterium]